MTSDSLVLVSRRVGRSVNSALYGIGRGREDDAATVHLHPDDAATLTLAAGDVARVVSDHGEVCAVVEVDGGLARGVVSLTHGRPGVERRPPGLRDRGRRSAHRAAADDRPAGAGPCGIRVVTTLDLTTPQAVAWWAEKEPQRPFIVDAGGNHTSYGDAWDSGRRWAGALAVARCRAWP